jgi:hypothetical protein
VLGRKTGQRRRLGLIARHSPPACGFAGDTVAPNRLQAIISHVALPQ